MCHLILLCNYNFLNVKYCKSSTEMMLTFPIYYFTAVNPTQSILFIRLNCKYFIKATSRYKSNYIII